MALCHTAELPPPLLHLRQPIALALALLQQGVVGSQQARLLGRNVLEHLPQGGGKGQKEPNYSLAIHTPILIILFLLYSC